MSAPTLLTCLDGFDRLKTRVSFLELACRSTRLQDSLERDEFDGLVWFCSDFKDEFDRLLSCLQQVAASLLLMGVFLFFSSSALAQTSTSIVKDGGLVDITIPGDASLEQLKEIRLISKDVLTVLEKQLEREKDKSNHAETVDALFWYALLISPLVAFTWLLYKVKKLTVQTQQQQSLFIESRQALPLAQQQPLVMLSTSQALERRV